MRCKNTGLKWSFISNEQAGNPYIKDMICKQWGSVSQTTNIFIIYQVINLDRKCKHLFLAQKKLIMQTQKHSHEWGWGGELERGTEGLHSNRPHEHTLRPSHGGAQWGKSPVPETTQRHWPQVPATPARQTITVSHRDSSGWEREVKMRHVPTDERTAGTWRWDGHAWTIKTCLLDTKVVMHHMANGKSAWNCDK